MDTIFTPHGSFILDFLAALLGIGLVLAFLAALTFGLLVLFYLFRAWTVPAVEAFLGLTSDEEEGEQ